MASTHKHIRSGTANKRPTTAIADGQIALNTNLSSPGLFFKDSTGAEILKIGPVHVGATAPNASPAGSAGNSTGEIWLDTSLTPVGVKIWNGSAFVNATPIGSTTVQGLLELATDAETQAGADTARAVTSASLQSKLSDSTSTTSNTTIASSTAVKAAYDLANAALPKTGGTVTGNLEIGTAGSLSFEGATADGFETTIAVVDPTADRTITLPNTTGTVVTTGDSGTVTSTMLLDGTILNEDINASASIAYSKLATLTSGNIVLGSSANVATSTAVTGDVTITNAGVTAIAAGVIVNADVNASAAIAGSKVAPDFGAQNIVTTGSSTAATFNPTGTTAPVTGVYSPGANRLGITTNSVERVEFGTSEVVFNDDAADYDFRIEGDTNSNLFFADASAEAVGIRTATPVSEFNVSVGNGGNITISNTNDAHSAGLAFGDTTSNSSGRITYDHSTNALAISTNGTSRLHITSGGLVGIGTSSPGGKLDVRDAGTTIPALGAVGTGLNVRRTDGAIGLIIGYENTIGGSYIQAQHTNGSAVAYPLYLQPNGGNVGIGTTAPSQLLEIKGANARFVVNSTTVADGGILLQGNGTTYAEIKLDASSGILDIAEKQAAGNITFSTGTTPTERVRVDSSGSLLVGTSTSRVVEDFGGNGPQGLIQIEATNSDAIMSIISAGTADAGRAGTLSLGRHRNSTVGATPTIVQNGDTLGAICFAGGDGTDMRTKGASIVAQVDGTPGADDMPGRLVFSVTKDGAPDPTGRAMINNQGVFHMFAVAGGDGHVFMTGEGAGTTYYLFAGFRSATSVFGASAAMVFQVFTNGNTQNTNNSYAGISDLKLKENIVDATSQWDDLKALQVRKYNFKEETGHQTHTQIGLVAQEVELVSPGLVNESPDRDAEGNDLGTVTKSVNYSVLYMKAVKALQEAMERIEQLEAKVAALEAA